MSTTSAIPLPLLQRAQIAAPCHARWEDMKGDERTRHCDQCNLDVHNIAGLTESEAEALLRAAFNDDGTLKQRLCARIYRRTDGTIITADCPVGLAAIRARVRRNVARVAAALGITTLIGWVAATEHGSTTAWAGRQPFASIAQAIGKQPPVQAQASGRLVTMGSLCELPTQASNAAVTPAATPVAPVFQAPPVPVHSKVTGVYR